MTDAQLTTAANTIKNESTAGSNTATRLGDMFLSLINDKINADKVVTTLGNTNDKIPTEKAVKDYVDANAGGGSSTVTTVKVSVTSAEILALNTTPKVLVAAQGAGKFTRLLDVTMRLNFGTTSYTGGSLRIKYTSGGSFIMTNSSHTNFSSIIYNPGLSTTQLFTTGAVNDNLILDASSAITNGDGTIDVYITYTVITL